MKHIRRRWWALVLVPVGLAALFFFAPSSPPPGQAPEDLLSPAPPGQAPSGQLSPAPPGQGPEDLLSPARKRVMAPDRVARLVNPRPGHAVLDLGAGFGLFTFALAQAAGDTATVYATDIYPFAIQYLAEQARRRGVTNVVPVVVRGRAVLSPSENPAQCRGVTNVVVRERGLDPFYTRHTFDVIFVADLLPTLPSPRPFFEQLRASLKEGTGRLWVLHPRLDPDLDSTEFGDFTAVRELVRSQGSSSPIVSRLRREVQDALSSGQGSGVAGPVRALIVEDLNRILEDPTLWPEIKGRLRPRESFFASPWKELAEHLAGELEAEGVFAPGPGEVREAVRPTLRSLNRRIIEEAFGSDQWARTFRLEWVSGPQRKRAFLAMRDSPALPVFLDAGYELVREHKVLVYHHVWEFKRAR